MATKKHVRLNNIKYQVQDVYQVTMQQRQKLQHAGVQNFKQ